MRPSRVMKTECLLVMLSTWQPAAQADRRRSIGASGQRRACFWARQRGGVRARACCRRPQAMRAAAPHLLRCHACVAEHAYLLRDERPVLVWAALLQGRAQLVAHARDAARHHRHLAAQPSRARRQHVQQGRQRGGLQQRPAAMQPCRCTCTPADAAAASGCATCAPCWRRRTSPFHASNMAGSPTTSAAMRAPCVGGLLHIARARRLHWLSTALAACSEAAAGRGDSARSASRRSHAKSAPGGAAGCDTCAQARLRTQHSAQL